MAAISSHLPEPNLEDYKVFVVALSVSVFVVVAILAQLNALGLPEEIYFIAVGGIAMGSLVFLLHPFVGLALALIYLISPVPSIADIKYSAAITALLIGNCLVGSTLVAVFRDVFDRRVLRFPLLLCLVAGGSAAYGLWRGNQASLVAGDFYQALEFSAVFFLAKVLVKSEQQFHTLVNVIVGAIVITSVLQTADVLRGASYLPNLDQQGFKVARTINMNAPIAFVTLLATLGTARQKKWVLAGMGILLVNLIWSFTRGLWLAAIASSVFLLIIQGGKFRRAVLKGVFAFCLLAFPLFLASGLGSIVAERIGYSSQQLVSVSEEDQNMSGRRLLEYILVLPHVAEHPLAGNGLGATFLIAGDAVLEGPKGEQIDFHYIHNLYLSIAFRLGIPALFILFVLLWKYFQRSTKNLRDMRVSPGTSALLAGLIAAMFGEVVLSVTSPTLLNHPTAGLLGCIMAVTTTQLHANSQITGPHLRRGSKPGGS